MEVALYKLNTEKRLDSLKDTQISEKNQKLLLNFVNYCFSEGIGSQLIQNKYIFIKYFPYNTINTSILSKTVVIVLISTLKRPNDDENQIFPL